MQCVFAFRLPSTFRRVGQPWTPGLTQEQLAFEAEIDLTYMGGIERGKRNPSLSVMARIANALAVPLPKLLGD